MSPETITSPQICPHKPICPQTITSPQICPHKPICPRKLICPQKPSCPRKLICPQKPSCPRKLICPRKLTCPRKLICPYKLTCPHKPIALIWSSCALFQRHPQEFDPQLLIITNTCDVIRDRSTYWNSKSSSASQRLHL
uniref:Uncharacterized protein n=1 Tax=Sparus aurata TaxID=8175 RepID=A0A671W753_SPAAU